MMTRFPRNTRLWCLTILMFSAFAVNALTLNPLIEAPEGHTIINQEPLLFNEQIIFVTEKDDGYTLWSYDLNHDSYIDLQSFEQFNASQKLNVVDGHFYFRDYNEPSQIWRSDGTTAGTNPVPGLTTFRGSHLQAQNNLLFAQGGSDEDIDIVGFDGESFRNYGVEHHAFEEKVCAFSLDDVIIPSTNLYAGDEHYLIRYMDQNSTDYTGFLPDEFTPYGTEVWQFGNNCFYLITAPDFYDILVIPEEGEKFFLAERLGFSEMNEVIEFKDNIYAIGTDADENNLLVRLSSDLSQIEKESASKNYLNFISLTVSNDYLIATEHSGGNVSPPAWATNYYDENLNVIEGLGGPFKAVPKIYPTAVGETVYIYERDIFSGQTEYILATEIGNLSNGFAIKGHVMEHVITNATHPETYTLMRDLTSGIYRIHHFQQLPNMGALSVGNWYDPDYQSQGMSIVEGLRDDGSRYLFVTLYLFQDGEPLWLAGSSNIEYPQPALDIELGAYSGPGLWQADTPATVEKFADMTLSMSGCHQMMVNFVTVDGQTYSLELQRMVNNDINQYCKD